MPARLVTSLILAAAATAALAASPLPPDVKKFAEQREMCQHFLGEIPDPGQKARMKEVNRAINDNCKGTDRALANLKKKYAKDATVSKVLSDFDPKIGM